MQACEGANRTDGARVSVLKNTARLSKCRSIVKAEYFNKWIYKFSLITPNGSLSNNLYYSTESDLF